MLDFLLATLPELFLVLMGSVVMLVGLSKDSAIRASAIAIAVVSLVVTGWLVTRLHDPLDVRLLASGLLMGQMAIYVKLIAVGIGLLAVLLIAHAFDEDTRGDMVGMLMFSTAGLMLTGSSTDLITLFFALELTSLPTYVLVTLSRKNDQSFEAGTKYFFLGALSAALIVYGFALIYGATGTTLIGEMVAGGIDPNRAAPVIPVAALLAGDAPGYWTLLMGLLLAIVGIAFKIAAFPLHLYAGDVYSGAHPAVTGYLGFAPKMAGFVALIVILVPFGWPLPPVILGVLVAIAIITMFYGNLVALVQDDPARMLAYSSVAHSGYVLIGVIVGTAADGSGVLGNGLAAVLFYLGGYGVMNLGAFAVLAYVQRHRRPVESLDDLNGLSHHSPLAALTLLVCSLSLLGIPPLVGFFGKVALFGSAWTAADAVPWATTLVILAVINSAISAGYYLRLVAAAYFQKPATALGVSQSGLQRATLIACLTLVVVLGLRFDVLYNLADSNVPGEMHMAMGLVGSDEALATTAAPPIELADAADEEPGDSTTQ